MTEKKKELDYELVAQQDFCRLYAYDPYLALRMRNAQAMLEHRGITTAMIREVTHQSRETINRTTRFGSVAVPPVPVDTNHCSIEAAHKRLDILEEAITIVTDMNGGVYSMCGCNAESVGAMIDSLEGVRRGDTYEN